MLPSSQDGHGSRLYLSSQRSWHLCLCSSTISPCLRGKCGRFLLGVMFVTLLNTLTQSSYLVMVVALQWLNSTLLVSPLWFFYCFRILLVYPSALYYGMLILSHVHDYTLLLPLSPGLQDHNPLIQPYSGTSLIKGFSELRTQYKKTSLLRTSFAVPMVLW